MLTAAQTSTVRAPAYGPAQSTTAASALLAAVAVEFVALYAPTARWLFHRWTASVWQDAQGLLIACVVVYLIVAELGRTRGQAAQGSAWGFVFLVPAALLRALDAGVHTELLSAVSLIMALPGLLLLFVGVQRTQATAFPLAFAFFMLPLPLALTEPINTVLRSIAAQGTVPLVRLAGIPVLLDSTTLHLPNATLLVAEACSGFATAYTAAAVALLTAYTATTRRGRLAPLVAALPLAIGANILRIAILAILVHRNGTAILDTSLHTLSGLLTFALVLPIILWLGGRGRDAA